MELLPTNSASSNGREPPTPAIAELCSAATGNLRQANEPTRWELVRDVLKYRRRRAKFFKGDLFADPAWDILLELYAAELGQRRMSVSSLCLGAAVPGTTALRWIKTLERMGLICRANDPMDGRRVFLSLSSEAVSAMDGYFATVPGGAVLV